MSRGPALDDLLGELRSRGDRITTARRAVLEELLAADDLHLSAEELATRINRDYPEVHLSTVYRTLEFLEHVGILTQVHVGHGPSSYHFADQAHHHAVCDTCGAVIELPESAFRSVTTRLERDHGFVARPHHLTITGTCAACRSNGTARP